jgi:hypothetical protein
MALSFSGSLEMAQDNPSPSQAATSIASGSLTIRIALLLFKAR